MGETYKASIGVGGAARPPIGWRVGPTMVLICIVNIMLQVLLPAIKLHLPMEQLLLALSVLLLMLINGIEPQVEVREMFIQILIEMGSIKARRACDIATPSHGGSSISSGGADLKHPTPPSPPPARPSYGEESSSSVSISISSSYTQFERSKQVVVEGFGS